MSRKFKDSFLKAYCEYADDSFCPAQFHIWTALSMIAGALERKCWLPWNDTYSFYPNLYVLLVSPPGQGKSTASGKGFDILKEVSRRTSTINVMPTQVTEAKFIELMGHGRAFTDTSSGKELMVFQNAAYYYASEASNSLRNIFGDFIACLTDFYDCPAHWERATKKDGRKIALKNVCMNILAGSTFDYLSKLVNDENVHGGFASRMLYVVQHEPVIRTQEWQSGETVEIRKLRDTYREALIHDLTKISEMTGPMTATPEFGKAWEAWYPKYQQHIYAHKSEKLRSILARANTNVLKVSILLSAAESNDRILKLHHFEQARDLIEGLYKEVPGIFRKSKSLQGPAAANKGGNIVANSIIELIQTLKNPTESGIISEMSIRNYNSIVVKQVLDALMVQGTVSSGKAVAGVGATLVISGNADDHL